MSQRHLGACLTVGLMVCSVAAGQETAAVVGGVADGTGNCCVPFNGSPGCTNPTCEAIVCALPGNDVCCTVDWDDVCADAAADACATVCTAGPMDCCISKASPGCSDPVCEQAVCSSGPDGAFCCNFFWDSICIDLAIQLCGDTCAAGSDCARDFVLDLNDHAVFFDCTTGPGRGPVSGSCTCPDADADTDVDLADWAELQIVLSGA